jgi:hypothetical protein
VFPSFQQRVERFGIIEKQAVIDHVLIVDRQFGQCAVLRYELLHSDCRRAHVLRMNPGERLVRYWPHEQERHWVLGPRIDLLICELCWSSCQTSMLLVALDSQLFVVRLNPAE